MTASRSGMTSEVKYAPEGHFGRSQWCNAANRRTACRRTPLKDMRLLWWDVVGPDVKEALGDAVRAGVHDVVR